MPNITILALQGLTCNCISKLTKALEALRDIQQVAVTLNTLNYAKVTGSASVQDIIKTIEQKPVTKGKWQHNLYKAF
ncbi:cation transporter [Arsenophonus endosymbiont of Bemisia tabaci]|uniref:cation transporter n=1 Tax=Arsenophonus endosymbiont of Bemisia tabaci TaxID=536059 RepID=UPI001EE33C6E|nr:cation transporter [Arsenophonus endosymbiont of Bemisia tabaci]